ncbi:MAG: ribosome assembly RNA-binding protein YhbY [Gammaproteobacteria bacterium]|nr:ribosome assembly RNA-binding protein YhbY [Gammaproteobacteria bacterium]
MSTTRSNNPVTAAVKRRLRARAHGLKPVIIVGASGLSAGLMAALEQALDDHALIKVRVNAEDRSARREMIAELCGASGAQLVQTIGHVAVLFREPEDEALRASLSEILD